MLASKMVHFWIGVFSFNLRQISKPNEWVWQWILLLSTPARTQWRGVAQFLLSFHSYVHFFRAASHFFQSSLFQRCLPQLAFTDFSCCRNIHMARDLSYVLVLAVSLWIISLAHLFFFFHHQEKHCWCWNDLSYGLILTTNVLTEITWNGFVSIQSTWINMSVDVYVD